MGLHNDLTEIAARSAAWRLERWPDTTKFEILGKATEELGEVARALVGERENRPGRGDAVDEIAQSIVVLSSMVAMFYPDRDLSWEVRKVLVENGA